MNQTNKIFLLLLLIYSSSVCVAQWNTVYYPVQNYDSIANIEKINFLDVNHGVAACLNTYTNGVIDETKGSILLTRDGGVNWTSVFSLDSVVFTEVVYIDSIHIIASGYRNRDFNCRGVIALSNNNGLSWDTTLYSTSIRQLEKINDSVLIANVVECVHPREGGIYRSTDKGMSWTPVLFQSRNYYGIDLEFYNDSLGLIADYRTTLLKTSNQGLSFDTIDIDSTMNLEVINISNNNKNTTHQYILSVNRIQGNLFSVYQSINNGTDWTKLSDINNSKYYSELNFVNDSVAYLLGDQSVLKSTDGGLSWQAQTSTFPSNFNFGDSLHDMFSISPDTLFITGNRQFYSTYNGGDSAFIISIKENELFKRRLLLYPNPTQQQVNLNFEVKAGEQFVFALYNLQGKLVYQKQLQKGKEHRFPIIQIKQGLYLYQVRERKGEYVSGKLLVE